MEQVSKRTKEWLDMYN